MVGGKNEKEPGAAHRLPHRRACGVSAERLCPPCPLPLGHLPSQPPSITPEPGHGPSACRPSARSCQDTRVAGPLQPSPAGGCRGPSGELLLLSLASRQAGSPHAPRTGWALHLGPASPTRSPRGEPMTWARTGLQSPRTRGAAWPRPTAGLLHSWGLQGSPTHREHHLHPLRRGGQCAWASLSEAWQGPGRPFCHPQVAPAGVRSGGSPATSGLWEKGHRKRGWASDPGAPSQPHPPGRASGDPAGTFWSCPAGHAHARLPLQHQGEAEGIGFCHCKQAPENHQLPGQGLAASQGGNPGVRASPCLEGVLLHTHGLLAKSSSCSCR